LIDCGDDLRLDFADVGDGQRPGKQESARGATGQTDLGSDRRLPFEQGYILDEQTQYSLALGPRNARIMPDARKLFSEVLDSSPRVLVHDAGLLLGPALVVGDRARVDAQSFVPFGLERICDEPVVGIDIHVATAGEIGFVTGPIDMLAARRINLVRRGSRARAVRPTSPPDSWG